MEYGLLILLLVIAILNSSVGHGGASGYIAVLALIGWLPERIRLYALLLNVVVSLISFLFFLKKKDFPLHLISWLLIGSIPAAYIGGHIKLDNEVYRLILGVFLLVPACSLLGLFPPSNFVSIRSSKLLLLLIGVFIGLLSGMIGIGGGVILTPILLMLRWATVKQVAAMSALFIFANSIAALIGMGVDVGMIHYDFGIIGITVIIGGLLGSYLGSRRYNDKVIKAMISIVLLIASAKLIFY